MVKLIHPVNPKYVRVKGDWGSYAGHRGRDYGWVTLHKTASQEVRAAAVGKVVRVVTGATTGRSKAANDGWGNQIIIQHTDKSWTTYNHLAAGSIKVSVGETVKAGELIARMGQTGDAAKGVHLHFEVRINTINEGGRVAPAPYFVKDLPGTPTVVVAKPQGGATSAFPTSQVVTTALNLRSTPSTSGKIVAVLKKDQVVNTGKTSGKWANVRTSSGATGWVHTDFIMVRAKVTTAALNLRTQATTKGRVIRVLPKGTKVTIVSTVSTNDRPYWVKVKVGTQTGYVYAPYLK